MAWNRRGFVIYPATLLDTKAEIRANTASIFAQAARLQSLNDELKMFDKAMRLTSDGVNVTHRAINTMLTDEMDRRLQQAFTARQQQLIGLMWFVIDTQTGVLLATNSEQEIGQPFTFQDALTLLGLETYQEEVS